MECYIARNAYRDPERHLLASIEWLRSLGGGTVVSDLRQNLERTLDMERGKELERYMARLSRDGVTLTWRRKGLPFHGNVVAAYTTPDVLHELDEREDIERLLVLGWSERDWDWWAEKNDLQEMAIE